MKLDIKDVLEHMNFRYKVNNLTELDDIEWFYDGEKVDVTEEELSEFKFTGLSNLDFVTYYLLDKIQEEEK